jgi:hypothetical protein
MTDMTFESATKALFEYQMRNIFTAIPAKVMMVENAGEQRVSVKPLVNAVFPDWDDSEEFPTILSVPLMYPSSSSSAVVFPVHAGDTVLIVFAQSCMDVFKGGDGSAQPPSDYRRFDKRDAIAIPGLFPFGSAINQVSKHTLPHSTDDLVVFHNLGTSAECELRMKQTGKIEINGNQIDISSSTQIDGNLINTGSVTVGVGATGSFTTPLGQIVTVTDGIITNII